MGALGISEHEARLSLGGPVREHSVETGTEPLSDAETDLLANRATFSYRVTDFDFRYADIYLEKRAQAVK